MELDGKTAIITGAASGIGRSSAILFAKEGAKIVAVDIDQTGLDTLLADAPNVVRVVADVSTPAGADRVLEATGGSVDILFNNAGVVDRWILADEMRDEDWAHVVAVNMTAPFLLSKRVLPLMTGKGRGVIINTASVAGLRGGRAGPAYTASKFGAVGLTYNIAATYGPQGIRCNAICPSAIATHLKDGVEFSERGAKALTQDKKPAPGSPDEVAAVALFLASDRSSRVNGVALPVDAGWLAF